LSFQIHDGFISRRVIQVLASLKALRLSYLDR